jgi:hypothetical protein
MTPMTKTTWTPAWAVRPDGSQIDEYRISAGEYTVTVRNLGTTKGGARWTPSAYAGKFGATRREAIEKFRRMAERGVRVATAELETAVMLRARADALAAAEPQEPEQVQ